MEFINPEGLRIDGRRAQELRLLKCEVGHLPKADGSASFETGNTRVIATIFGPKPGGLRPSGFQARGRVRCEVSIASFCSGERRRRTRGDRRALDIAAAVQAALDQTILLELLPKSEIEVFLQVLQADGGEKAACINAAMLATTNAGIPVRDLVAAISVGYLESTLLLDLNLTEVNGQGPQAMLAFHPSLELIAVLETSGGSLQPEVFEDICLLAQEGCKAIGQFMRTCLLQYTEKLALCQGVTQM